MVDFIGLGAQKAGTSWIYACLYEHPEIHAPIKELHFFSRDRFEKGVDWYESHFTKRTAGQKVGEFSTSYLYSNETPARIASLYPKAKLIAVLRNPVDRAYSQYRNAIKSGEISKNTSFEQYQKAEPSVVEQGKYAEQLERYYQCFDQSQILVLIYEDSKKDPGAFMQTIYTFLGVDPHFIPSMLHREVNIARTPKVVGIDRVIHKLAEFLRRVGMDRLVWVVKKSGLTDHIRSVNTASETSHQSFEISETLRGHFASDAAKLSMLIGRDMKTEWKL